MKHAGSAYAPDDIKDIAACAAIMRKRVRALPYAHATITSNASHASEERCDDTAPAATRHPRRDPAAAPRSPMSNTFIALRFLSRFARTGDTVERSEEATICSDNHVRR
jgi:hypothetical protein